MRFTDKNGPIELAAGEGKRIVKAAKKTKPEVLPAKIDDREEQALTKIGSITSRIKALIPNEKTGVVIIKNQKQAELAGELIKDEDATIAFIDSLWREEAKLADLLHKSLTGKIRKYTEPEKTRRERLRLGLKMYLAAQEAIRKAQQEQVNALVQKQFGDIPVAAPVIPAAKVGGFGTATVHGSRIVDKIKLIRELLKDIERGKVSPDVIQIDQRFLDDQSRQYYESTPPSEDGKRYRYDGALEIYTDSQLRKERG
jgi:hypothetical protein